MAMAPAAASTGAADMIFFLVARAHHRLDELSRCLEAAVWADSPFRIPEVLLLLLSHDGAEVGFLRIDAAEMRAHFSADGGPLRTEAGILRYVEERRGGEGRLADEVFATVSACMERALSPQGDLDGLCAESDMFAVLHEDSPLLLPYPATTEEERLHAARWRRSFWLFGVHEDFTKEIREVVRACGTAGVEVVRVSLGPVALQSSACVHTALGLAALATPADPLSAYASLATAETKEGRPVRLKPTADEQLGIRAVPNRGLCHFWVALHGLTRGDIESKLCQLVCTAGIWASKSAYRSADTKVTFVLVDGGVASPCVTFDRSLLDFMPREDDDGKAPNEKNVSTALRGYVSQHGWCDGGFAAELERHTSRATDLLLFEVAARAGDDGSGGDGSTASFFPDAEEVRPADPHPRDWPLHVFLNFGAAPGVLHAAQEAVFGAAEHVVVRRLTSALRGTEVDQSRPATLARAVAVVQALHSLARLKPIVKAHAEVVYGASSADTPPAHSVSAVLRRYHADLGLADAPDGAFARDTPHESADNVEMRVSGEVAATRTQGTISFIGLVDAATCERLQVVVHLRDWEARWTHAVRKLAAGDVASFSGVACHTATKGRLSMLASSLAVTTAASPAGVSSRGVAVVCDGTSGDKELPYVVVSKASGAVVALTSTTKAADRPTACCKAAQALGVKRFHPTHTAERDASGICVFAKTGKAADAVAHAVKHATKRYIVVAVCLEEDTERLPRAGERWTCSEGLKEVVKEEGVSKTRRQCNRVMTEACTEFECLLEVPGARAVVLSAVPLTACTRQVRRHMAQRSLYLIGDHLQGQGLVNRTFARTYSYRETSIHLLSVTLPRDETEEGSVATTYTAPFPPAFRSLLASMPCNASAILALQRL